MNTTNYKDFQVLTLGEIELLEQSWQRLLAEGFLRPIEFGEYLDIVIGRGEYDARYDTEVLEEMINDVQYVTPPDSWIDQAWLQQQADKRLEPLEDEEV